MPHHDNHDGPRAARSRRRLVVVAAGLAVAVSATLAVVVAERTDSTGTLPAAGAEPTSAAPSTTAGPQAFSKDQLGYLDSAARCDDDQELVVYGRTARALIAICVDPTGELEYRGVRISDEASLQMPAGRAADGSIVATNNGVTYAISPEAFLVSEGDAVLYRDPWVEFGEPRFPTADPSTSSSAAPSPSTAVSTTVSTTTVTMTPGEG